mmetsp:Transcript_55009/g.160544  ORF Transcript_55009/g.160544 Transcript_55009/m.160544 type:complete len:129 (-) Transcript_55009:176-562(-)
MRILALGTVLLLCSLACAEGAKKGKKGAPPGGMPELSKMGDVMFQAMDTNGDGIITREETMAGSQYPGGEGMPADQADEMFKEMDENQDGKITRDEANKLFEKLAKKHVEADGGKDKPGVDGGEVEEL